MTSKPVIAIDIDEVLARFLDSLNTYHNENYGTSHSLEEYHSYEFHKIWGGSIEETSSKIKKFFDSKHVHELDTLPGSLFALKKLQRHFNLHVVTARHNHAEKLTREWISRHYPDIFTEIHFGNHYCPEGKSRSKAEICRSINAKLLVDDSISYARNCASEGIPVILFGKYPWNRPHENDKNLMHDEKWLVKEASHWDEVVNLIFERFDVIEEIPNC